MTSKEQIFARHDVVNGSTPQPHIEPVVSVDTTPSEPSTEIVDVKPPEIQEESPVDHGKPVENQGQSSEEFSSPEPIDHALDPLAPPHIVLREAEHRLDLARAHARECRSAVAEARANFARCLGAWNASGPAPHTQAELMKEHIASNQAERAKRYAAGQGVFYPGVGRTAKALAGGNAKNGGGASYRRGAYTRAEAMTANSRTAAMARAKAAFKPPSER